MTFFSLPVFSSAKPSRVGFRRFKDVQCSESSANGLSIFQRLRSERFGSRATKVWGLTPTGTVIVWEMVLILMIGVEVGPVELWSLIDSESAHFNILVQDSGNILRSMSFMSVIW